jgi:hypothetical protein
MADPGQIICANRDCRIAETGRCVEGLELTACPHYGHEPIDEGEPSTPDDAENVVVGLRLPGADTLTLDGASRLLRKTGGCVIAVIGPRGVGKTSLIASLYDLFQKGAVAGVEYARSDTLHAFELACHDARAASRRSEPDMERTPLGEVRFYHLDVAGGLADHGLTLLLGDRAGEEYRLAADDVSDAAPFPEVIRADTVTVLVDGQRLADAGARHNLRNEIIMILQALLDGGAFSGRQRLVLVLTKLDAVQASPHQERALADFASLQARVASVFGHAFGGIETCKVAASPKTGAMRHGTGVAEVLEFWAAPAAPPVAHRPTLPPAPRAFSRLTELFEADGA